jgi:hypothetical protein
MAMVAVVRVVRHGAATAAAAAMAMAMGTCFGGLVSCTGR